MTTRHLIALPVLLLPLLTSPVRAQDPAPLGEDFQVNSTGATSFDDLAVPAVAAMADGSFVVVWEFDSYDAGYANVVLGRRFDPSGGPLGPDFGVSPFEESYELFPEVAAAGDNSFVVVWARPPYGGYSAIRARHFDSNGVPSGLAHTISQGAGNQEKPDVAAAGPGRFVSA